MRAAVAPVVADLPPRRTLPLDPWEPAAADLGAIAERIDLVRDVARRWHGRDDRISVHVAPSAPQRCTDELFAAALALARDLDVPLHTHALETRAQAEQARRRWSLPLLRHLDRLGSLGPRTVLAHVAWLEADDPELIARAGAVVVHNPASNLALGSGRAAIPQLLRASATVALGTDAATCNDGLSMFEAMKLATIVHRPDEPDWEAWPRPHDAIRMATEGGAAALGRTGEIGRVAEGHLADLAIIDARSPALVPRNDLGRQLVMRAGADTVRHVLVAGRFVVRDRRLLTLDVDALGADVSAIAARRSAPSVAPEDAAPIAGMLRRLRQA